MIDLPSKATLRKYGLTEEDYVEIWDRQGGVCAVCKKFPTPNPKTGKSLLNVDHEHVPRWKSKPPELRKIYVRALLCWACNRFRIFRGATAWLYRNAATMLEEYENRRDHALGLHEDTCTC